MKLFAVALMCEQVKHHDRLLEVHSAWAKAETAEEAEKTQLYFHKRDFPDRVHWLVSVTEIPEGVVR